MSDTANDRIKMLELAERRLKGVLKTLPAIVWEAWTDPQARGKRADDFVSDYVETMTGYTAEEWLSQDDFWLTLVPAEEREATLRDSEAIFHAGSGTLKHRWRTKDGRKLWVETYIHVVRDASGAMLGVHGVTFDVTPRQEAELRNEQLLRQAQQLNRRLDGLIESIPGIVWESWGTEDVALLHTNFVSDYVTTMTGYTRQEWLSAPDFWMRLIHPDDKERVIAEIRRGVAADGASNTFRWITKDNRTIWVDNYARVVRAEAGEALGVRGITMDVTARKRAEDEQARLQQEVIDVHARTLAELSTPLIPINKEVLVMPLIGSLDQARSDGVIQTLLAGITRSRARVAILDITGVPGLDTGSADAILRAAKGARLLGARVVLTGIRPEVAQTLVTLGADLSGIVTRGTLEDGIAFAMGGDGPRLASS
jgi:PAS domain S-box-containing protein